MLKCICVDRDKKNRESLELMIKKVRDLHLAKTYAKLDAALTACKQGNIRILFVGLHDFPVDAETMALLKEITKHETKIIILSSRTSVMKDVLSSDMTNFLSLPTSARRLWQASMKALQIDDFAVNLGA